ncbi:MAG: hypothetical protein PHH08_04630, partial [Candidatus ainarchaeum sp.]|nr:hypothetical protein [Candidatus ainarchaeum sp.]
LIKSEAAYGKPFGDARVLNLGSGILEGVSPVSEQLKKVLEINNVKIASFVAVDRAASNSVSKGITYRKADIFGFLKRLKPPFPNIVVLKRVLEHLADYERPAVLRLCWSKLPEGGFFFTDFLIMAGQPIGSGGPASVILRKINGRPELVYLNLGTVAARFKGLNRSQMAKKIQAEYADASEPIVGIIAP